VPQTVFKYKTVVVKQPTINTPEIYKPEPVLAATHHINKVRKVNTDNNNSELAQQLRSVYASERIEAVMQLSTRKNLNAADLKMLERALSEDPNPNVRLMVVNSLRPLLSRQNVQQVLINSLDRQDDVMVQTSIVDMLVTAKSKQALPQMITLLDNKNTDAMVQNKIKDGIETFLN
jgi:HEAT repeat protein